jgi:predicted SpoU family rRNA methylase
LKRSQQDIVLMIGIGAIVASIAVLIKIGIDHNNNKNTTPIQLNNTYVADGNNQSAKSAIPLSINRDSLKLAYNNTLSEIDNNLKLDFNTAISKDAQAKLEEMSKLKIEIATLLKDQSSDVDLKNAQLKILDLQQKVMLLQGKSSSIEAENKRLQAIVNQLLSSKKSTETVNTEKTFYYDKPTETIEKIKSIEKTTTAAAAFGLHLFAVSSNNNKQQETNIADVADKIIGSFSLKNNSNDAELIVVVTQPDGKIVKSSVWDSGTFNTKDGKKVYSKKINVDAVGDDKQYNFSLTPDGFLKGNYTLQVWYNGSMIAKTVKRLS